MLSKLFTRNPNFLSRNLAKSFSIRSAFENKAFDYQKMRDLENRSTFVKDETDKELQNTFNIRKEESSKICMKSDMDWNLLQAQPVGMSMVPLLTNLGADYLGIELMSHYTADALFYFYLGLPCCFLSGINFAVGLNQADQAKKFSNVGIYGNLAFISSAISMSAFILFPSMMELSSMEYMLGQSAQGLSQTLLSLFFIAQNKLPRFFLKYLIILGLVYIPFVLLMKTLKDKKVESERKKDGKADKDCCHYCEVVENEYNTLMNEMVNDLNK